MTLHEIGMMFETDKATYHEYCDFYQAHLPGRNEPVKLLEIGVKDGASLKMWRHYFNHKDSKIVGIDINRPIHHHNDGFEVLQMDATDDFTLSRLPRFNIIIDDGSHMTKDQQFTFEFFMDKMQPGDIYIIEDIHTSDWGQYRNSDWTTERFVRAMIPGWQIFIYQNPDHPGDSKTMLIIKP